MHSLTSSTISLAAAHNARQLLPNPIKVNQICRSKILNIPTCLTYTSLASFNSITSGDPSKLHQKNSIQTNILKSQLRRANTSSGFYAPQSTVIKGRSKPHHAMNVGNLNVFEASDHLPKLPVPNLNSTLEQLKESISPVAMNSLEYVNTLKLIDKFSRSAGPKLDILLRNKAEQTKNWLTHDWWLQEAYLKSRRPLVINSNPAMIYPELPFEVKNQRALVNVIAQFISSLIDYKLALLNGYNPEATTEDSEFRLDSNLCYNQYKNIFGGTRLPGENQDSIKTIESALLQDDSSTVVISFKGRFYEIQLRDIEDEEGRNDKLVGILGKIIASEQANSSEDTSLRGAGVLTTANRNDWAKNINLLDEDSMLAVQKSQFVVSIDTIASNNNAEDSTTHPLLASTPGGDQYLSALGRQVLHGDIGNVGNRWFDKGLQLILVADENAECLLGAGINYEHSFSEAAVVSKMIEYSFDKIVQSNRSSALNQSSSANFFSTQQFKTHEPAFFRQLRMFNDAHLNDIISRMKQAKQDFASQVDQFELSYLNYKQYGKNAIKSWHFSPDSWFQVALLSAYYNVHKRLGTCYESASTRRFAYGRTETIRSLTKEVAQFCIEPRYESLQAAVKSHKAYAIAAGNGIAIDRVLLGYKKTFDELKTNQWAWGLPSHLEGFNVDEILNLSKKMRARGSKSDAEQEINFNAEDLFNESELNIISAFFNNELIKRSNKYALSTSQVSSIHPNIYMCYGAFLVDGYGCCYNITGQQLVAAITANSSNQSFSCEVEKLHNGIEQSLDMMRDIVEEEHSRSKH